MIAGEDQPGHYVAAVSRPRPITNPRWPPKPRGGKPGKGPGGLRPQCWNCSTRSCFRNRISSVSSPPGTWQGATRQRRRHGERGQANVDSAEDSSPGPPLFRARRHISKLNSQLGERVLGPCKMPGHHHDHFGPERDGGPRGRWRNGPWWASSPPEGAAGGGRVQGPQILRHGDGCRQFIEGQQPDSAYSSSSSSQSQEAPSSRCASGSTTRKTSAPACP